MKAKLIVVGGTTSTNEVYLKLPAIIGRGRSAQITIPHSLVSRQHCEISEDDGQLVVRDLDSLNGTYVGDERITEAVLSPGSLLTVGTVTFRAVYEVGCADSDSEQSSDTCFDTDTVDGDQDQLADFETVPVESPPSLRTSSGAHAPKDGRASEEAATEAISDRSNDSPLESAARNSD
ncbi:MAG: FHA domain-containing protein [Planctomycetaceae bacterium]|nr:FHA domain-containing protein [Planctomycetales bacterium]MCB9925955.1 FHA domain-containing protein [Planctomycetaceae bacterium]